MCTKPMAKQNKGHEFEYLLFITYKTTRHEYCLRMHRDHTHNGLPLNYSAKIKQLT